MSWSSTLLVAAGGVGGAEVERAAFVESSALGSRKLGMPRLAIFR